MHFFFVRHSIVQQPKMTLMIAVVYPMKNGANYTSKMHDDVLCNAGVSPSSLSNFPLLLLYFSAITCLFYSLYCSFIMPPLFVIQEKDCNAIQMLLSQLKISKETFIQMWDKMCVLYYCVIPMYSETSNHRRLQVES